MQGKRTAEAVSDCGEGGDALLFESFDHAVEDWSGLICAVIHEPFSNVELLDWASDHVLG